jgi:hypothetical protein
MPKELLYSEEARRALERGVNAVANAVRVTLGPKGRNVVLDKKFGAPSITKDGVTVAKEIELAQHFENLGAQLVREVASKDQRCRRRWDNYRDRLGSSDGARRLEDGRCWFQPDGSKTRH